MQNQSSLDVFCQRIEERLERIEKKLDTMARTTQKSFEWIGVLSEHIESLDAFREEVRASFEPFTNKLDAMDDVMRIIRHATGDVSRRLDALERNRPLSKVC